MSYLEKVAVWDNGFGGIALTYFDTRDVEKYKFQGREEHFIPWYCSKIRPGESYELVDINKIPKDRSFRSAWEKDSESIKINMEKARDVQRDVLRLERQPLLEALDIDFLKAVESGDQEAIEDIKKKKEELRNLTDNPKIENAKTPEELKAITIEEILKK